MESMILLLKILGMGCMAILGFIALIILISLLAAVVKTLIFKKLEDK